MRLSGILDQFESFDLTPAIGREFPDVSLAQWIQAPNSAELLRDLAITSSQASVTVLLLKTPFSVSDLQAQSPSAAWCSSAPRMI